MINILQEHVKNTHLKEISRIAYQTCMCEGIPKKIANGEGEMLMPNGGHLVRWLAPRTATICAGNKR
jgi:hypothetical protein